MMQINLSLLQIQKYKQQLANAIEEKRECQQELKREKSWNNLHGQFLLMSSIRPVWGLVSAQ
jgi:hypothetical protein